jgi:GTP pyrophosphokinase
MDHQDSASLQRLLAACARYMPVADLELVRAAYLVAAEAHEGILRASGEPFIEHPLEVASTLAGLAMDAFGIAAALLHDTVEDTSYTLAQVEERFGPTIAGLVDGVTKFTLASLAGPNDGGLPTSDRRTRQQKETVRKLVLAMLSDPRVVLLKLADRLHNMRTLASMTPAQQVATSRQTLEIYAPLAGRIGLQIFKSELEDLAFFHLQPDQYARVDRELRRAEAARRTWADHICAYVADRLAAAGIPAAVNWRLKRPYRAHLETLDSGMTESQLHDIIAFRVLVNTSPECYRALGVIHSMWRPLDTRIRDYIANPKVNGYRSLHTAVFALDQRIAQFHIRTHDMHRWVQHGVATHWLDRAARHEPLDGAMRLALEDLPAWVAQLDDWHRELRLSADAFVDALTSDLFDDQVFVFTPIGEIIDLRAGSTPLDFAYRIHSDLGDHFARARVQTRGPDGFPLACDVSMRYPLQMGDVVTVYTDPTVRPQRDWLDFVRTRTAREKILRALRAPPPAAAPADDPTGQRKEEPTEAQPAPPRPLLHPSGKTAAVQLARCCYPCPGDEILALSGRGHLLIVHRACCRTLARTLARRAHRRLPDPSLPVDWRTLQATSYRMAVAVHGQDHAGLMHELASCAGQHGINIAGSSARAIQDRNKAIVRLICEFSATDRPEEFLHWLGLTHGTTLVQRDMRIGCVQA